MSVDRSEEGRKKVEIWTNQVCRALEEMQFHGWDGTKFFERARPEMRKSKHFSDAHSEKIFLEQRARYGAEKRLIHNVAIYVSYITCPSDEENIAENIIESEFQDMSMSIAGRNVALNRANGVIAPLDHMGYDQSVTTDEKIADWEFFRDNFLRLSDAIDKSLSKIKLNIHA